MDYKDVAIWFAGLFLTVFGWMLRNQIERIDKIERDLISRNDLKDSTESITSAVNKNFEHVTERLADIKKDVGDLRGRVDHLYEKSGTA